MQRELKHALFEGLTTDTMRLDSIPPIIRGNRAKRKFYEYNIIESSKNQEREIWKSKLRYHHLL